MGRMIDVDKLGLTDFEIVMCSGDYKEALKMLIEKIENAPTVDVVRCKDCKWGTPDPEGDEYTKCFKLCTTFFSGHYCAWGERKEDA